MNQDYTYVDKVQAGKRAFKARVSARLSQIVTNRVLKRLIALHTEEYKQLRKDERIQLRQRIGDEFRFPNDEHLIILGERRLRQEANIRSRRRERRNQKFS